MEFVVKVEMSHGSVLFLRIFFIFRCDFSEQLIALTVLRCIRTRYLRITKPECYQMHLCGPFLFTAVVTAVSDGVC